MRRRRWALLTLLLLVSCDDPTGSTPSAGQATLDRASANVSMQLNASTLQSRDSHQGSAFQPWTAGEFTAQFDESRHVAVQAGDGDASAEAALSGRTSVGTADGVVVSGQFEIDALGRASQTGTSSVGWSAQAVTRFDVASGSMRYDLSFDQHAGPALGMWMYQVRLVRVDVGETVFDENRSGQILGRWTRTGTLPPGRYEFAFNIANASHWREQGLTSATGDAQLWFAVK